MPNQEFLKLKEKGDCLMDIGCSLMGSGANTGRIRLTMERIASVWNLEMEVMITHRALLLTVADASTHETVTVVKRTPPYSVNFTMVSGVSRMSWRAMEQKWDVGQVRADMLRLKQLPHYNRYIILIFVSLAGVAFCRNMGGSYTDALVTFVATFAGLFVRQEAHKKEFNPYLTVLFASLTATIIAGLYTKYFIDVANDSKALATSVLFLIPGVPLINSFSDMIDGNLLNGILRVSNGLIIAFAIAFGLVMSWLLLGLK